MVGTSEYSGTSLIPISLSAIGGNITTSQMPTISGGTLLGNPTTSVASPIIVTPSADFTFSGTSFAVSGGSMVKSNSGFTWNIQRLTAITDGTSGLSVPAGYFIDNISIQNTNANAITGGLKIGTTTGATDVLLAVAIGANAILKVPDALLLKTSFSTTAVQTLFVQTVTLWNSANINLTMYCLPI